MPSNGFRVEKTLGTGSFGSVVLLTSIYNPSLQFAVKQQRKQTGERNKMQRMEYLIHERLSQVGHENVIKLHARSNDDYYHNLFLDYIDGGELFDKVKQDVGIGQAQAQNYFQQIISGLEYIHGHGFVHRDIKLQNILLTKSNTVKICDFGMAAIWRHKEREALLNKFCGTEVYCAPEMFLKVPHRGPPLDIWSTGIVLFAMLSGAFPWARASKDDRFYQHWINGRLDEARWPKMDDTLLDLFRKLLIDDPKERITIEQIKDHPWFKKDFSKEQKKPMKRSLASDELDSAVSKRAGSLTTLDAKRPRLEPLKKRPQSHSILSSDVSSASEVEQ
ncbi:hypothetical protein CAEBREN_17135 [Caenorhabditis brenneri]|uniref:non-specific serine/threonine protein kinase n=1 Tax=Caenorhabditis brenneri TaxID=135651 RepID=G0MQR5_CAEBE|nr:hypothetical protein CAEBREN_17135 [Caenorhabditis brenneri]